MVIEISKCCDAMENRMFERLKTVLAGDSYAAKLDAAHALVRKCDADLAAATEAERAAVEAMGEAALDTDGPVPAAVLKAVATARGAAEAASAARIAAKVRLSALIAAGEQDSASAAWDASLKEANLLVEKAQALDALLQQAADAWNTLRAACSGMQTTAPIQVPMLAASRVAMALELARERVGLPSNSTFRRMYGELVQPPNLEDTVRDVVAYLESRRPGALRNAA